MQLPQFTQKLIPIALGLGIAGVFAWGQIAQLPIIQALEQRMESLAYDMRLNASLDKEQQKDERVVIVDIDEKSLRAEGRWPWSRAKISRLTEKMFDSGAVVVGYDVFFSEPERNSAEEVLKQLQQENYEPHIFETLNKASAEFDYDTRFAASLQDKDVVLGYLFHDENATPTGELPEPLFRLSDEQAKRSGIKSMPNYTASLGKLQQAAAGNGFATIWPDPDGIIRRAPMIMRHGNNVYSSLSLSMSKLYLWLEEVNINTAPIGELDAMESINLGGITIPTDGQGFALVPYRGPTGSFPYVSATDVLNDNFSDEALEGAIVLVGSTAVGIADLIATPVENIYPGVEVHATLIAAILDKYFPTEPGWAEGANFTATLSLGLLLAVTLPFLSPLRLVFTCMLFGGGVIYGNTWLWQQEGIALALAWPLLMITTLAAANITYGFIRESRKRTQLKNIFGQYVPPQLVDTMSDGLDSYGFGGESREMTVLFADIRGFTTLSEQLSPSELRALLNKYFTHMTEIIFKHNGTIDKYVGDMIMAFWGAPLKDSEHAKHAIEAAMEMLRKTDELRPQLLADGYPNIDIGIGLNTGTMNVGDMGSSYRRAYTVLGDNVNLGSRIEGLTKFYGARLVVGEATREEQDTLIFRPLDLVKVKGKTESVRVYEPICNKADATEELLKELEQHEAGLNAYKAKQWQQAKEIFTSLLQQQPDAHIYKLYLNRISELEHRTLPDEWDGVYERREK